MRPNMHIESICCYVFELVGFISPIEFDLVSPLKALYCAFVSTGFWNTSFGVLPLKLLAVCLRMSRSESFTSLVKISLFFSSLLLTHS